jgi:hypothetical protein
MTNFTYSVFYGQFSVPVEMVVAIFAPNPPIAEIGSTVPSVILNWGLSKAAVSLSLNGVALNPAITQVTQIGPFTDDTTWELICADEDTQARQRTQLEFLPLVYWGVVQAPPASSADILALTSSEFIDRKLEMTVQYACAAGGYPCIAYPASIGLPRRPQIATPDVMPNTLDWNAFTDYTATTVSHTNASGYTQDYLVLTFNTLQTSQNVPVIWT